MHHSSKASNLKGEERFSKKRKTRLAKLELRRRGSQNVDSKIRRGEKNSWKKPQKSE